MNISIKRAQNDACIDSAERKKYGTQFKKTFIAIICMVAGLTACTNDDNFVEEQAPAGVPMSFNISVNEAESTTNAATTRAAKTSWANGDKIYVFFNGLATKYLILTYDGSSWANTSGGGTLLDTDFSGLGTKKLTAVHFPVAVDVAYADNKFSFTSGGKPVYNYYLFETGKDYTVDGTTITATLSMGKPTDMVQIHVAGIQGSVADYTFGCSKMKPVACASVGTDGAITESVLQAGARVSGFADSDGGIFAGRLVYPGTEKDYTFTVASDANIYTLTRTGKTLTAGKMYNFPSLSTTGGTNWTVTAASDLYVDLGITVDGKSVKWAKCNLGATTETGYGDYFAWGEVTGYNEGKKNFAWSTYTYGSAYDRITKYCNSSSYGKDGFTDALTILQPEDDAAYAALGGKFRMPTKAEFDALLALSKEWVTNYNSSGINGYKFTGNGQTLFLPAAGRRYDTYLYYVGSYGTYLSSSLNHLGNPGLAWSLNFVSDDANTNNYYRYGGFPVRPVSE